MPTVPETKPTRGGTPFAPEPRLTLVLRNRSGSEVTPALVRRLALAFGGAPIRTIVADETIKMPSTELLAAAGIEGLDLCVVRARGALADVLATISTPYVAIADADERHPPELLPEMLNEAESRGVDLVLAASRERPGRIMRGLCGGAIRGVADPLTPFFVARSHLVRTIRPKPGASLLALDLLLALPNASVSELPVRHARRPEQHGKPPVRRRFAEAAHVVRLGRAGARIRAGSVRGKATDAAWAIRRRADHPATLPALGLIVIVAAVLRFWALPSLHFYGHDEARASLAAQQMLVDHRPVLVGQPTSRGVYLGPGYYYLVAPFYAIFGMSPFAGAFLAAIAGIAAVYFTYRIGREIFGAGSGLAAAAILATAPISVYFSRFGWNPNTLPLFASLFVFALIKAHVTRRWLAVAVFCAALAPQLHASGLILPATLSIWLLTRRPQLRLASWMKLSVVALLPLLPMIAAELRGGFAGTKSWIKLILGKGDASADAGGSVVGAFKDVFVETIGTARFAVAAGMVLLAIVGLVAWERNHWNDRRIAPALQTLALFQIVGLAGAFAWRGQMFGYWLLPWIPGAVVMFAGGMMHLLRPRSRSPKIRSFVAPVVAVALIAGFNVAAVANPTKLPDQFQSASAASFHNVAAAADWIAARAQGSYDLQVWTPYPWDTARNSTFAFDYLLLRKGLKVKRGSSRIFVVAMEDVNYPYLRTVRGLVMNRYAYVYPGRAPVDAQDFGGLTVFQLER